MADKVRVRLSWGDGAVETEDEPIDAWIGIIIRTATAASATSS